MICPACRAEVVDGARFCPQCAAPVAAAATPVADPLRAALESAIGFQYQVVRLLGRGGMGAVYLAHELALDRDVAIKVLPPDRGESVEGRERFRREARTAARLTHPNIVPLLTFGEVSGLIYFVMGYVRGEPLSARLKRQGRLRADETRRIIAELAEALDYAHRQGVVHRDIKPDNVLIEAESGRPMLADFGVAKAQGSGQTLTSTGSIVGTPHYMSPEQAAGKGDLDGRSDLYSLGVVGYEMIAGRRPFEGKTAGDVLVQHMTKEPTPLQTLIPDAPAPVVSAVMRCLAKDPGARWADGKSLRAAVATPEDESRLPRNLRGLDTFLQIALVMTILAGYGWVHEQLSLPADRLEGLYEAPRAYALIFAFLSIALAVRAKARGFGWRTILRSAFRQPAWWMGWYPQSLRRPKDVWDRLPPIVRLARNLGMLAAFLIVFGVIPLSVAMSASGAAYARYGQSSVVREFISGRAVGRAVLLVPLAFLAFVVASVRAIRYARTQLGASTAEEDMESVGPIVFGSTAKPSYWHSRHIAPLLRPEAGTAETASSPQSAEDCERAVALLVQALPDSLHPIGRTAADAAARLRAAIARLDEEAAGLAKDADPAEAERLEAKLTALGAAEAGEPEARRQMRDLLGQQLGIVRGLGSRLEEARRNRAQTDGLLKSLWRETAALATNPSPADTSAEAANRLRALCAQIEKSLTAATPTVVHGSGPNDVTDLPTLGR